MSDRDDLDRATRLRTLNQPQETVEVIRAAEHRSPVIAAIQYVVVQAGMDAACGPWHVVKVGDGPGPRTSRTCRMSGELFVLCSDGAVGWESDRSITGTLSTLPTRGRSAKSIWSTTPRE